MAEQGAQDAGVGDDDGVGRDEAAGEIDGPGLERGHGLAAGGDEMQDVGGPGVERMAVDLVPASPLLVAKINFAQARVGVDRRAEPFAQGFGKRVGAAQRAADDRQAGWQAGSQPGGKRLRIVGFDVQSAVADAALDQRARVADQEKRHSSPA